MSLHPNGGRIKSNGVSDEKDASSWRLVVPVIFKTCALLMMRLKRTEVVAEQVTPPARGCSLLTFVFLPLQALFVLGKTLS